MHIVEATASRLVFDVENVSTMRYFFIPILLTRVSCRRCTFWIANRITSTAEKIQKTFPLLGREAWLDGSIRGRRDHWRGCLLQLFKFRLNFCPVPWFSLRRVRSIRMPIEFQKLSPNLRRSTTKILLRQRVQQLCMRLIVEPIYSRPRYFTGVKILVGQVRLAGAYLG